MGYVVDARRKNPKLAIFLTLALGFALGRVRIGSFQLGNVVGTLLAGVVIGQLNVQVPATAKVVLFDLVLFATEYKVGPQFVHGLGGSAVSHLTALLFGKFVLKMSPVILLSACAGAGTSTAALRAIQDEAGSKVPVLGTSC